MRGYRLYLFMLIMAPMVVNANYWFQSGATSGSASYNNGAAVTIQTVYGSYNASGSVGFWVGENLDNGAFLQAGYMVPNVTGYYPSSCTSSGCVATQHLTCGTPEWFYEYFPPEGSATFMGVVGPDGSAGKNGTSHTYGFYAKDGIWYFFMDNQTLGQINLNSVSSGRNGPVAFAELANSSGATSYVAPVVFSNLSVYKNGKFLSVPYGYSFIGYGVSSMTSVTNPYGVEEIGARVNYFKLGSGLQEQPNGQQLWQLGYYLNIISKYGNISGTDQYIAYKRLNLSTPATVQLNQTSRASFTGWTGSGVSAYTGHMPTTSITLYGNVTETANWDLQYLLNISSAFGTALGSGWYKANSTANYSLNSNSIYKDSVTRLEFKNWTTGSRSINSSIMMDKPHSIGAIWQKQYFVNVSSSLGGANGTGWYAENSIATISLSKTYLNTSGATRTAFYSWNNGNRNDRVELPVHTPIFMRAIFKNQSLVRLDGVDQYGSPVHIETFHVNNASVGNSTFMFNDYTYDVNTAYYKGTTLSVNRSVSVNNPANITIQLPIYNVQIRTLDIFGIPVNALLTTTFLNGTVQLGYSGPSGTVNFYDVPYGSTVVSATIGGETLPAQTKLGSSARITVLSAFDIEVFAAAVITGFLMYIYAARRLSKSKSE